MLAASHNGSAMQHMQTAFFRFLRLRRAVSLAVPVPLLMCRSFPSLPGWGCTPCPPQEENRCHCPPKDSCRQMPDCPPPCCEPPHCRRPGPEICISRPCDCNRRPQPCKCPPYPPPEPCREDCCSSSRDSDLRHIIDLLCQMLNDRRR